MVECLVANEKIAGSNPVSRSKFLNTFYYMKKSKSFKKGSIDDLQEHIFLKIDERGFKNETLENVF